MFIESWRYLPAVVAQHTRERSGADRPSALCHLNSCTSFPLQVQFGQRRLGTALVLVLISLLSGANPTNEARSCQLRCR